MCILPTMLLVPKSQNVVAKIPEVVNAAQPCWYLHLWTSIMIKWRTICVVSDLANLGIPILYLLLNKMHLILYLNNYKNPINFYAWLYYIFSQWIVRLYIIPIKSKYNITLLLLTSHRRKKNVVWKSVNTN